MTCVTTREESRGLRIQRQVQLHCGSVESGQSGLNEVSRKAISFYILLGVTKEQELRGKTHDYADRPRGPQGADLAREVGRGEHGERDEQEEEHGGLGQGRPEGPQPQDEGDDGPGHQLC